MKLLTSNWEGYELIDSGNGMRLERFGKYKLVRPDPQAIWKHNLSAAEWENCDAIFEQTLSKGGGGKWVNKTDIPDKWLMHYGNLSFFAKLTPFKHTGVFPEQAVNWEWLENKFKVTQQQINVLNLFAYTGIASLVCVDAGARVTHVDASHPSISWARENQIASDLENKPIRWILDDAIRFVQREIKRGVRYDGIIMDPPVYGHGPNGEPWDFNKDFPKLFELCGQILTDDPIFILINAYAISASAIMLENLLLDLKLGGVIESGELVLQETNAKRMLSTGIFARWARI
jgi:23S rRNA (cytosine1962-C5)-methyltransferase